MVRKMYLMLLAAPLALAACSDRSQTSSLSARPSMSQQALATSQQALQTAQQAQATAALADSPCGIAERNFCIHHPGLPHCGHSSFGLVNRSPVNSFGACPQLGSVKLFQASLSDPGGYGSCIRYIFGLEIFARDEYVVLEEPETIFIQGAITPLG
jgi:hypothetical protein